MRDVQVEPSRMSLQRLDVAGVVQPQDLCHLRPRAALRHGGPKANFGPTTAATDVVIVESQRIGVETHGSHRSRRGCCQTKFTQHSSPGSRSRDGSGQLAVGVLACTLHGRIVWPTTDMSSRSVGSSPRGRFTPRVRRSNPRGGTARICLAHRYPLGARVRVRRAVAQLGSAPDWGSGGRRFKSCQPDVAWDLGCFLGPFQRSRVHFRIWEEGRRR